MITLGRKGEKDMGIMNLLLGLYTAKSVDKDCEKGEDKFSFKKVLIIGGICTVISALIPVIVSICMFSYGKKRVENMHEQFVMKTGTFAEKQTLLEPEELKSKYTDLFDKTNRIDFADDAVAEAMADYGMIYLAGDGSNDIYVVSDGYFMYYLDMQYGVVSVFEITNEDGSVKSLNDFMSEISSK